MVSLFSDKWMVYDQYCQFMFDCPQASGPRLRPAAATTTSGEMQAGPIPNAVYKQGRGDLEANMDADELALTPEALAYHEELHTKRKGIADDV